jgi:hypothetical protein
VKKASIRLSKIPLVSIDLSDGYIRMITRCHTVG